MPGHGTKVKIEPQWLSRIILGKAMDETNEKQIREWAQQRTPPLTVAKAHFDPLDADLHLS